MSDPRPGAAPHRPPGPEPAPAAGRIDVAFTFGPISVTIVAQDPTAAAIATKRHAELLEAIANIGTGLSNADAKKLDDLGKSIDKTAAGLAKAAHDAATPKTT